MNMNRSKLISAVIMLVLSVAMLTGASLAWFTVSTAPEISGMQVNMYTDIDLLVSKDGTEGSFTQSISTQQREKPLEDTSIDNLPFYAPLKPVSTVDGVHWFLPKYLANGALDEVKNFPQATQENVNVVLWSKDENGQYTEALDKDSVEHFLADNMGYYVYADIWLMTENENGVDVTLSVPNITPGQPHGENVSMQSWELGDGSDYSKDHGKKYGSYALGKYDATDDGVRSIDNNAQTALRVGFLVDDVFTIYEPNADQRSEFTIKPKDNEVNEPGYVVGYKPAADGSNYKNKQYIPTNPIGLVNNVPTVTSIPANRLLVQLQSKWNEDAIKANYAAPTSADVDTFGRFIPDNTSLGANAPTDVTGLQTALASNNKILSLEKDTPKMVRVFFWLEGQDADCWNDIASGSFLVNLEFAAQERIP